MSARSCHTPRIFVGKRPWDPLGQDCGFWSMIHYNRALYSKSGWDARTALDVTNKPPHVKGILIPESRKFGVAESVIQEIFAFEMRNPGLWNPLGIQLKGAGMSLTIGIQNLSYTEKELESITWNLESTAWNPEFSTVLDSLIWAKQMNWPFWMTYSALCLSRVSACAFVLRN